jgi:hypothetical protein
VQLKQNFFTSNDENFPFLPHINLLLCFPIPHYHSSALEDMRNAEVYKKLQKLQIFISDHPDVEI